MKLIIELIICFFAILISTCSNPSTCGNGSDVGNPVLSGHVIDGRTGKATDSTTVRLYKVYLNKKAQAQGKAASTSSSIIDSIVCDKNGLYKFDSLENGIYSIESEKIDGTDTLTMRHSGVILTSSTDVGYDTLYLPGWIKGTVSVPSGESRKNITCYISGTSYMAITDDTGSFKITGIPTGTYSLSITSSRFNDTTLYNIIVIQNKETSVGNVALSYDLSKNEHNVWGFFDSTTNYKKIYRMEARISGDSIKADSPYVYTLDWRQDVIGYSGFIYLPSQGYFWTVSIWVYDSLEHRIGAYSVKVNKATGDIQIPTFDPCNGIPKVSLTDTTVGIYDTVNLHAVIYGLLTDDSIVNMSWDIGNTGIFNNTIKADTQIIVPDDSGNFASVFRVTDRFGNIANDTGIIYVYNYLPVAYIWKDTSVYGGDSFTVHYSGKDSLGRIVKYRFDINNDHIFEDSSTTPGVKNFKVDTVIGKHYVVLQVEDNNRNKAEDTMTVLVKSDTRGLVAYWSFDSSSADGKTYYDVTGHGYDAIVTGTGITTDSGVVGKALSCPGSGYEIYAKNSSNDFYISTMTIECWFYSNVNAADIQDFAEILAYQCVQSGVRNGWSFDVNQLGNALMSMSNSDGSDWENAESNVTINKGKWYHLVGTYDSSYTRIYLDGVLTGKHEYQGTYAKPPNDARIGCTRRMDSSDPLMFVDGKIDELKLYNYALPADSIVKHYNKHSAK